jgi:pimeloyl-ACP methyl ester carboxylesterase
MSLSTTRDNPTIQAHRFDYNGTILAWEHIYMDHSTGSAGDSSHSSTADLSKGPSRPLIILHGWGASKKIMQPLARMLAFHHDCYVIDLAGFGESSEPPFAWKIDDYADSIQAWADHIGLLKFDLLAHSFGGRITLKLLTRPWSKEHVQNVLITGGAGMKPRRSASFYAKKYVAKILKAPFNLDWLRATSTWKSLGSSEYAVLSGVMRETFVHSVTEYLEPTLPKISHSVLLLWGENDDATPLYQAQRMEKGLAEAALVVMDGCGHYAFLDKPKQFVAIAEAYLKPTDQEG